MRKGKNEFQSHIVSLSMAKDFDIAKVEWELSGAVIEKDFHYCPCGQPIKERCFIRNTKTNHVTYVGNVCIGKFLGIEASEIFTGLKKIAKNKSSIPNKKLTEYASKLGFMYEGESKFIAKLRTSKKVSPKQSAWVNKINYRIINQTVVTNKH